MKIKVGTAFLCLLSSSSWAADPDSQAILKKALNPPTIAYQGVMTVTHWYGDNTRMEEIGVRFLPPDRYRLEILKPDGRIDRIVLSDGETEQILLPNSK